MATFLHGVESSQPFLLCVGGKKTIPCMSPTAVGAFDKLFKVHFVFSLSYDEALFNFYNFIQTTIYGIDVATTKESPRVKEKRVRINNV